MITSDFIAELEEDKKRRLVEFTDIIRREGDRLAQPGHWPGALRALLLVPPHAVRRKALVTSSRQNSPLLAGPPREPQREEGRRLRQHWWRQVDAGQFAAALLRAGGRRDPA